MNILVTTDGTEQSLCILPHAARIAEALGAGLVLGRVLDKGDAASVRSELQNALQSHQVTGDALVIERRQGEDVAAAIHRAADELPAGMLAMASRGRGAIKHAIFGSVSLDVVARADLPVMVLTGCPPASRQDDVFHVLVTYDGSPDARSVFEMLVPLLVAGRTRVTLLEVAVMSALETESEAAERVRPGLEALAARIPDDIPCNVEIRVVPPAAGIDTAIAVTAKELGVDAIASATHGHSARRHLVTGSVAQGVVKQSEVPVILVKSRAAE